MLKTRTLLGRALPQPRTGGQGNGQVKLGLIATGSSAPQHWRRGCRQPIPGLREAADILAVCRYHPQPPPTRAPMAYLSRELLTVVHFSAGETERPGALLANASHAYPDPLLRRDPRDDLWPSPPPLSILRRPLAVCCRRSFTLSCAKRALLVSAENGSDLRSLQTRE